MDVVKSWIEDEKVDGKVCQHDWVNFGHNRTLSIKAAKHSYPDATYLLFIDCDMVLKVEDEFDKDTLTHDSYSFVQVGGETSYYNTRLAKASLEWICVGVTHEYLKASGAARAKYLDKSVIWIDDIGDGGCKDDKFTRDRDLLIQGIKDEPKNVRYYFYLAQTYLALKQYNKAIQYYNKRIELGDYLEEVYFSYYNRANCYNSLGKWPEALDSFLSAYNHTPERAEPLYEIVKYYRIQKKNRKVAVIFCREAMKIKYPKHLKLFISDSVYDYLLDYEYSILAYYFNDINGGLRSSSHVLASNAPENIKACVRKNFKFYKR
uniref:Glycosyl transferase family 2 n=1 Tax=Pithovirus LCPAC403 TaxID=2506596 RepID=A0A481ZAI1_9VIRU|nr:MAG: glycosyl transferase family 2 [Pithovirus LCPAC403]